MSLRSFLPFALVALAAASLAPACSNQGLGQACNIENNSADCEDGLVCVSKTELLGTSDICCPAEGSDVPSCTPGGLTGGATTGTATGTGGAGGTGGTGGMAGAGGTGGTGGQGGGL